MIASCGIRACRLRIVEKIAAPMNVNSRLIQYTAGAVRIAAEPGQQDRDRGAERRDLREREVDEDDPPLDDVDAEVGVDAGDHQAGDERRREKREDRRCP